ncbi:Transcription repressor OFP17 [Forsythia ovata]|uniref:Transcription repressor OFP17 n=1 Tax=Forsythia ovata TaxID=205694 RepID=A0ABD1T602_9LAMI
MKLKIPSKLFNPCKKIMKLFKFKLRKPVFITSLRFRRKKSKTTHTNRQTKIRSFFHSLRQTKETDQVTKLVNFPDEVHHKAPHPSPLTPAYVKMRGDYKREVSDQDELEDACRSFENYLIQMIVEEGKMRDLKDVEEFLYCWKNLRCPIFTELVCRFYGELCNDLFSNSRDEDVKALRNL